jgi:hypothetical protein
VKISPKSVKHGLRGFGVFLQRSQNLIKNEKTVNHRSIGHGEPNRQMAEGNRVLTKEKKHNNEIHKFRKDRHPGIAHLRGLHVIREAD